MMFLTRDLLRPSKLQRGVAYRSWRDHNCEVPTDHGRMIYRVRRGTVLDGGNPQVIWAAANYVLDSTPENAEPTEEQFTPQHIVQLDGGRIRPEGGWFPS